MPTPHPNRDRALINAAGFLRSLGVGFMGVVLGIYLFRAGLSSFRIGLIIAAGGAAKVLYDALLYRSFRRLKPPEETETHRAAIT